MYDLVRCEAIARCWVRLLLELEILDVVIFLEAAGVTSSLELIFKADLIFG